GNQTAKAGDVKGLFPQATSAPPSPQSAYSPENSPSASQAFFKRLQGAAKDVARAAAIKKLQLHDLPQADYAIGVRALELSLGADKFADRYAEIRRLEAEASLKQQASVAPAHESMGDRAKRVAAEAKNRVD